MSTLDLQKENIYRDYYGKVYGYVLSHISSQRDAEDVVADVFLKVYKALDGFDKSKASLSTWIYTITKNTLTDYFRTRKVFVELSETQTDEFVEEDVCKAETLETLANALSTLDERERDIVILRYYYGKTLKEITAQMGISYAYGKVLQNKALDTLKNYFANQ